jgi:SagB-type dehydrogenase family enzyme
MAARRLAFAVAVLWPFLAQADEAVVALPVPSLDGAVSLEEALASRRSERAFAAQSIALADAGQMLWAAQGISDPRGFRTAPSAGALYPLEIWLVAGAVDDLDAGAYRYRPGGHDVEPSQLGDLRGALSEAAYGQAWMTGAAAIFVVTGREAVTRAKYGRMARRYMMMEAGHAAQNLLLRAVARGLAATVVGGFDAGDVDDLLDLERGEEVLLLLAVGRPSAP